MSEIIQLRNITKTYPGGVVAVDDLTFGIDEGEFVTFVGPSGCGKTTTLRTIGGFETPERGQVFLAGEDVTQLPPYRRQVNMVFQDYALFPHMTIRENVGYGLRVGGMPRAEIGPRVDEALGTVDLMDKIDARPSTLSGGQKQRVALARALVREPKVLLLDEPLSALDAKLREAMQVELKHLHERLGLTFVYVTHDQTEALVMSDRVVVMDQGRIVQAGTPTELYNRPATPYVANFIGTSNQIVGEVVESSASRVAVRFKGGEISGPGPGPVSGERAMVSVRPEKVFICGNGAAPPDGFSVVEGVLIDVLFRGDNYRLELDIGQEAPFLVDTQSLGVAGGSAAPTPGAPLSIAIDPETVSIFPLGDET